MADDFKQRLHQCRGARSVVECALTGALELTGAGLGYVQLMDWDKGLLTIVAQRGFKDEFVDFFRHVRPEQGCSCARTLNARGAVVIQDVTCDSDFAPYRSIAKRAGFQAVQSTPLISSGGAFLGVLSTHFPNAHRPSERVMLELKALAELTAEALIRERAGESEASRQVSDSFEAVATSRLLLRRLV
ncbi:MAG TPA: GAF domain-containing protein [Methylocystis sp.]|nr:GAF domain-containing protein [Methylocystis sp.]